MCLNLSSSRGCHGPAPFRFGLITAHFGPVQESMVREVTDVKVTSLHRDTSTTSAGALVGFVLATSPV